MSLNTFGLSLSVVRLGLINGAISLSGLSVPESPFLSMRTIIGTIYLAKLATSPGRRACVCNLYYIAL